VQWQWGKYIIVHMVNNTILGVVLDWLQALKCPLISCLQVELLLQFYIEIFCFCILMMVFQCELIEYILLIFLNLLFRVYHFCGRKMECSLTCTGAKKAHLVSYSLLFCTFCMNCGTLYINFFCKIRRYVYSSKTLIQKYPCIFLCNPANCMTLGHAKEICK
jgi:hypothetical protein